MGKTSKSSPLLLDHVTIDSLNLPQPSCSPHPWWVAPWVSGSTQMNPSMLKVLPEEILREPRIWNSVCSIYWGEFSNIDNYQLTILFQFGCAFSNWISLISWKNSKQSGLTPMNSDIPHVSSHDLGAGWLLKPSSKSSIASQQTNTRKLQHVSNFAHGKVKERVEMASCWDDVTSWIDRMPWC